MALFIPPGSYSRKYGIKVRHSLKRDTDARALCQQMWTRPHVAALGKGFEEEMRGE